MSHYRFWTAVSIVALVAFLYASLRILILGQPVLVVPNDYAAFLVMLPIVRWSMGRFAFLVCLIIAMATSMVADSRLCLMLCVAGLFWSERAAIRLNKSSIAMGVILSVALALVAIETGFAGKLQHVPTSRVPLWHAALHQVFESPLLGSGVNAFGPYYTEHIRQTVYPEYIVVDSRYIPWAHNLFLDIAVAFGIPASVLLLALLLCVLVKAKRSRDRLGNAILGSVLLFLLAALVEFTHLRMYTIALILIYAEYLIPGSNRQEISSFTK